MLHARDVRVVLGGAEVLRRVSLAVAPGQVVAVVGPNGTGKSTLPNVLSGSLPPRAGRPGCGAGLPGGDRGRPSGECIYTTLSGGERQRVQLARVLAQIHFTQPGPERGGRYLLLDEPALPRNALVTTAVLQ